MYAFDKADTMADKITFASIPYTKKVTIAFQCRESHDFQHREHGYLSLTEFAVLYVGTTVSIPVSIHKTKCRVSIQTNV